jgi:hypothetical protein
VYTREVGKKKYYVVLPLPQTLAARASQERTEAEYAKMEELLNGMGRHLRRLTAAPAG